MIDHLASIVRNYAKCAGVCDAAGAALESVAAALCATADLSPTPPNALHESLMSCGPDRATTRHLGTMLSFKPEFSFQKWLSVRSVLCKTV
ncbi:unnamed protein product [Arctia plantaginis]|uniref:Uncharacterized protein n=1 Tax=Arctia plantaginis TaxID=874455 RepID=A0A8S1A2K1_ARCPL|nr:unnamed protein product [Arctia plantaginis]